MLHKARKNEMMRMVVLGGRSGVGVGGGGGRGGGVGGRVGGGGREEEEFHLERGSKIPLQMRCSISPFYYSDCRL